MKAQGAAALAAVATHLGGDLGPPHLGTLLTALLDALAGRTWTGKVRSNVYASECICVSSLAMVLELTVLIIKQICEYMYCISECVSVAGSAAQSYQHSLCVLQVRLCGLAVFLQCILLDDSKCLCNIHVCAGCKYVYINL